MRSKGESSGEGIDWAVDQLGALGLAVFVRGTALAQVWLFLIFPALGGLAAG
jgi:hypothetical protein